jgi:GNAT superfamily N-acetyltransferase
VEIRPWRCGDEELALAAQPYLSNVSLDHRFLAGTGGRLPAFYLRHVATGPRPTWDAQVAAVPGHLIGWAEFGRVAGRTDEADLAVIVADSWQRRGIASALIRAMLPRAAAGGVRRLHADLLSDNQAAYGLLRSLFGPLDGDITDGVLHTEMDLTAAFDDCPPEQIPCFPPPRRPALASV